MSSTHKVWLMCVYYHLIGKNIVCLFHIYIFDTTHVTILVEHSMGGRLQKERDD